MGAPNQTPDEVAATARLSALKAQQQETAAKTAYDAAQNESQRANEAAVTARGEIAASKAGTSVSQGSGEASDAGSRKEAANKLQNDAMAAKEKMMEAQTAWEQAARTAQEMELIAAKAERVAGTANDPNGAAILKSNRSVAIFKRVTPWIFLFLPLAVGAILTLNQLFWEDDEHQPWPAFALLFAALVMSVFGLTLNRIVRSHDKDALVSGQVRKRTDLGWVTIFLGADGRISTSKVQVWLWSVGLAYAALYLSVIAATNVSSNVQVFGGGRWDDYLLLLGGPFAAAILAKYTVTTKIDNGTLSKPTTAVADPKAKGADESNPASRDIGGLVTNDAGNLDVVDAQYLLFNLVAFAYFAFVFIYKLADPAVPVSADKYTLPEIPGVLLALTGASAATYVGNKVVQSTRPRIVAIQPSTGVKKDSDVIVLGANLTPAGAIGDQGPATSVRLTFRPGSAGTGSGRSQLMGVRTATSSRVTFPMPQFDATEAGTVEVVVITAEGLTTDTFYFSTATG